MFKDVLNKCFEHLNKMFWTDFWNLIVLSCLTWGEYPASPQALKIQEIQESNEMILKPLELVCVWTMEKARETPEFCKQN